MTAKKPKKLPGSGEAQDLGQALEIGVNESDVAAAEQIQQNIETLLDDLKRNKPASSKGVFIKKLSITSTMGAGIELDMASLSF